MIPVSRPYFDERETAAVNEVFKSGWIGMGPKTEEFEYAFAKAAGVKYAVALNSCSSALHIAGLLLGVNPGEEVIVPAMTFIATACAVRCFQATPVICDVIPSTLLIDPQDAESRITHRTKAVFPVMWAGQPDEYQSSKLPIVYDCAQAVVGSFDASNKTCCWSFQAVKNLSTGDGGMITTDNEEFYKKARSLRWFGINRSTWERTEGNTSYSWDFDLDGPGFKYHMNDIAAAIGLVQLNKLEEMQAMRKSLYEHYHSRLFGKIEFIPSRVDKSSLYNFVVRTDHRDELFDYLKSRGIC